MAIRCPPYISIPGGSLTTRPRSIGFKTHNSSLPLNRSTALIRSYSLNKVCHLDLGPSSSGLGSCWACRNTKTAENETKKKQVFEDQSRGIICYRDDRGELVCEGYDEGPRFCQPASKKIYHKGLPAYFQLLDFLQTTRLLEDVADNGATIRKE